MLRYLVLKLGFFKIDFVKLRGKERVKTIQTVHVTKSSFYLFLKTFVLSIFTFCLIVTIRYYHHHIIACLGCGRGRGRGFTVLDHFID